jgi:hypothetical protein
MMENPYAVSRSSQGQAAGWDTASIYRLIIQTWAAGMTEQSFSDRLTICGAKGVNELSSCPAEKVKVVFPGLLFLI